jgi:hypothetical protein
MIGGPVHAFDARHRVDDRRDRAFGRSSCGVQNTKSSRDTAQSTPSITAGSDRT